MDDAFEMGEDRHPRLLLHAGDQPLAATRHDHVEIAVEPGQHLAHRGTVAGGDDLDRLGRQAGFAQAFDEAAMDRGRGAEGIRAATQDGGIAGLEAEGAGIGGDVRPALEDDADDAERRAHALDVEPVRPVPCGGDAAHRVGEAGDLLQPRGHRFDARLGERQPVDEGGAAAGLSHVGDVPGILGKDRGGGLTQRSGGGGERPVLRLGRGERQRALGPAGGAADACHGLGDLGVGCRLLGDFRDAHDPTPEFPAAL